MGNITNLGIAAALLIWPGLANSNSLEEILLQPQTQTHNKKEFQKSKIIKEYIPLTERYKELTKKYCKEHYEINDWELKDPKAIVVHSTHSYTYREARNTFDCDTLRGRPNIGRAGNVNVGAHFIIDRDGVIYQLTPLNMILRHAIGYNYCALGIENVAKQNTAFKELTPEQVEANADLIEHLIRRFPSIAFIFGHKDYAKRPQSCLVRAVGDPSYVPKNNPRQDPYGKNDFKRIMDAIDPSILQQFKSRKEKFLRY